MLRRVARLVFSDVSKQHSPFIFKGRGVQDEFRTQQTSAYICMSVGLAVERLGNNGESIGGGAVRSSGVEGRKPQRANEEISGRDLMCACGPDWFEIPGSH